MKKPELVVFDLDDTVYQYEPAHIAGNKAWAALGALKLNVSEKEFLVAIRAARERVKERLGGTASSHSRLLYAHEAIEFLGFEVDPTLALELEQTYWRAFILAMEIRPGCKELFTALRYWDVPVALVTDLTLGIQIRKLAYFELGDAINYFIASEQCREDKPSLLPFELLFEKVPDICKQHVWFIGDKLHDAPVSRMIEQGHIVEGSGFLFTDTKMKHEKIQTVKSFLQILAIVDELFRG